MGRALQAAQVTVSRGGESFWATRQEHLVMGKCYEETLFRERLIEMCEIPHMLSWGTSEKGSMGRVKLDEEESRGLKELPFLSVRESRRVPWSATVVKERIPFVLRWLMSTLIKTVVMTGVQDWL